MPWISTRALTELRNRVELYADNARGAWKAQASAINNSAKIAEKFVAADERTNAVEKRLDRALRACLRYRTTIARRDRRIRHLERRLDDFLGLNKAAVAEGALWQERREDKPKVVKP